MKDFLGREIVEGSYAAYPGAGNKKAEYGMILYRIDKIQGEKIKARRIEIFHQSANLPPHYPDCFTDGKVLTSKYRDDYKLWIRVIKSTLSHPLKLVVVDQVPLAARLILDGDPTAFDHLSAEHFAGWIHGSKSIESNE